MAVASDGRGVKMFFLLAILEARLLLREAILSDMVKVFLKMVVSCFFLPFLIELALSNIEHIIIPLRTIYFTSVRVKYKINEKSSPSYSPIRFSKYRKFRYKEYL